MGMRPPGLTYGSRFVAGAHVGGRVVPYAGMLTILMNDYPYFKVLLLGGLALFVIITRE